MNYPLFEWARGFVLDALVAVAEILGVLLNSIDAYWMVIALFFAAALVGAFFIPIMGHSNPAGSDSIKRLPPGKSFEPPKRISRH